MTKKKNTHTHTDTWRATINKKCAEQTHAALKVCNATLSTCEQPKRRALARTTLENRPIAEEVNRGYRRSILVGGTVVMPVLRQPHQSQKKKADMTRGPRTHQPGVENNSEIRGWTAPEARPFVAAGFFLSKCFCRFEQIVEHIP